MASNIEFRKKPGTTDDTYELWLNNINVSRWSFTEKQIKEFNNFLQQQTTSVKSFSRDGLLIYFKEGYELVVDDIQEQSVALKVRSPEQVDTTPSRYEIFSFEKRGHDILSITQHREDNEFHSYQGINYAKTNDDLIGFLSSLPSYLSEGSIGSKKYTLLVQLALLAQNQRLAFAQNSIDKAHPSTAELIEIARLLLIQPMKASPFSKTHSAERAERELSARFPDLKDVFFANTDFSSGNTQTKKHIGDGLDTTQDWKALSYKQEDNLALIEERLKYLQAALESPTFTTKDTYLRIAQAMDYTIQNLTMSRGSAKERYLQDVARQFKVKSKKCCKFPSTQPIKIVRYLAKAFISTTLGLSASFSVSQSLNSSILR